MIHAEKGAEPFRMVIDKQDTQGNSIKSIFMVIPLRIYLQGWFRLDEDPLRLALRIPKNRVLVIMTSSRFSVLGYFPRRRS